MFCVIATGQQIQITTFHHGNAKAIDYCIVGLVDAREPMQAMNARVAEIILSKQQRLIIAKEETRKESQHASDEGVGERVRIQ